jgi:hypothetical protein
MYTRFASQRIPGMFATHQPSESVNAAVHGLLDHRRHNAIIGTVVKRVGPNGEKRRQIATNGSA